MTSYTILYTILCYFIKFKDVSTFLFLIEIQPFGIY
ncbi:hypothetical protein IX334_001890 [Bacteroides pyogenes]|nr:hypothetical protein [Bacteroides pyogenes]MBR8737736.1 hypothetical protein [Bacteroides pyogenes]MBR8753218.1 hypothetical protein [Bacteroides pyogenes]MBR8794640.1 hypothetical protein [Bacteroides pyogenes]